MILIIDDKPNTIQGIRDFLDREKVKNKKYDYEYKEKFEDGQQYFEENFNNIDALVLDLRKDPLEEYPGKDILEKLWNTRFVPTVVFSVSPDEIDIKHNFIATFNKDQEVDVISWLQNVVENFISKIDKVKESINEIYRDGLRGLDKEYSDDENSLSVINYMAYVLEQKMMTENRTNRINPKIQYLIMDKYKDLQATDIIQTIPAPGQEPVYYMIITASCDLAARGKKQVVCKKIVPISKTKRNDIKVNDGGYKGKICLPPNKYFKNCIVSCEESFIIEDKEKISKNPEEIDASAYNYRKIMSIASPFKERIINLIYNHDGRIGVPDLDESKWWIDEA